MNVQIQHVIVHLPDQARDVIREALTIADELAPDDARWGMVFRSAVELLGQRWTLAATPQPVDLGALRLPNGRRQ